MPAILNAFKHYLSKRLGYIFLLTLVFIVSCRIRELTYVQIYIHIPAFQHTYIDICIHAPTYTYINTYTCLVFNKAHATENREGKTESEH